MEVFKKLLIILFTIFPFVNAHLDFDDHEYTPLEIKCNIDHEVLMIFVRETVKRECICKDGVYQCRTIHPYILEGHVIFRTRVQNWIDDHYDPFCVNQTQEIIVKGWACLCVKKKTWWCIKVPPKPVDAPLTLP